MPQRHGFIAPTSWKRDGIADAIVGADDHRLADLQRLAQRIEDLRSELRHLVEEEDAIWASDASPGRTRMPPPTIAAIEAE